MLWALVGLASLLAVAGRARAADAGWRLITHPDGGLFVGDVVSFEVVPPEDWHPAAADGQVRLRLRIAIEGEAGARGARGLEWEAPLRPHGIDGRRAAVFAWMWDTRGWEPGAYPVEVVYQGQVLWRTQVVLHPADLRPWWEEGVAWTRAAWPEAEVIHLTRTPAARDLALVRYALTAIRRDLARLEGFPQTQDPVPVVLMPRLLGQGGFASQHLWITYTDRDATGTYFPVVARHEVVHWLDRQRASDYRALMLVEGLAVYLAGGHYKPEPLAPRAAALLLLGRYIPLETLADGYFYDHQHEIAYLEAGALVEYLVGRWGWDAFVDLYWGLDPAWGDGPAEILDAGLRHYLGVDLTTLAADFEAYLRAQPDAAAWTEDVRLTVDLYEALRRYQRQMDPGAYYGTAWLPDLERMQQVGAVADAVRGPFSLAHVTAELLLQEAQVALAAGEYARTSQNLAAVHALLDAAARGDTAPWRAHPEAARVAGWVQAARRCNLEPTDLARRDDGSVWVWGWPRGGHPELVAMRIANDGGEASADEVTCRVDLRGGLVWPGPPQPVYLPGPRHPPRVGMRP
ncbi:MAG: hypothetical protein GXO37_05400 [Chloroflexi bacterium]|nr:hypothetical protein [Chloroflexota bacterium]